jgi:hypothetical protein
MVNNDKLISTTEYDKLIGTTEYDTINQVTFKLI